MLWVRRTNVLAERVLGRLCCQLVVSRLAGVLSWGSIREGVEPWAFGWAAKSGPGSTVSMTAVGTLIGGGEGLLPLGVACHMGALPHNTQLLKHQLPEIEGNIACS